MSSNIWIPNLANDLPTVPHPNYLSQERQLRQVLRTLVLPAGYPPQDLQQLLLLPSGVQWGQGIPGQPPSSPQPPPSLPPNSSLAHCCLPTLASRKIFQYSHLTQALTSSEAPYCPQDEFWIIIIIIYLLATCVAYGILVSGPGIEHVLSALAGRSPDYWTARKS